MDATRLLTLHHHTDYHCDEALLADIRELLAPSYERMGPFAVRALTEQIPGMLHELYTLRDEDGQLTAFYTVGYHNVELTLCCYLGLSAVRDDCKGLGLGSRLWAAHFADCRTLEARLGHRVLLYFTTASPVPFGWFTRMLVEAAPDADGRCDKMGRERLRVIAEAEYPQATWEAATPWLLRCAAPDMRYSAHETHRLAGISAAQPAGYFQAVRLDESRGDRLLVVGYAPST